jgi:UDP-N-acetylglucosamine--N-acetylmuramyl-(pentapeptide) pyrophosphoryl-undecaprenol N-acetylglucosamine transferase
LIFLTLGTHEQPLSRAIDVLVPLAHEHEIVVQHGHTPARHDLPGFRWERFIGLEQMEEHILAAEAVFCHAGVGCIMTAVGHGRTPVVIPRLSSLGEHVDDHQLQIASHFEARGLVVTCGLGDDPREAIERARLGRVALAGDGTLRRAVGAATRR